jgi:glycerol-3-phosphate dehydrogenase subunit C
VYAQLFREPNYKVVYMGEVLNDLMEQGKIKVKKSEEKIIFKDPCPLVRRHDMIEIPRKVLTSVAELVEYEEHGREAACCGAPAGVKPLYPEIANKLAGDLVEIGRASCRERVCQYV